MIPVVVALGNQGKSEQAHPTTSRKLVIEWPTDLTHHTTQPS